jgi:hypothetical protein
MAIEEQSPMSEASGVGGVGTRQLKHGSNTADRCKAVPPLG